MKLIKTNGMTRRDQFAAMAMQGVCGNSELVSFVDALIEETGLGVEYCVASIAVKIGDAMIEELDK
jgi:hypothetical protein